MKIWEKGIETDRKIEAFTVGNDRELDLRLAKYDILASKAHAQMLCNVNLITVAELKSIIKILDEILQDIERGDFTIEPEFEDVHSKIEYVLIKKLGDAGKKIHTARSRNDQVLTAIKLYLKEEIKEISSLVKNLFDLLLTLAEKHKAVLMPGYTHLQVAMPSSFGLWFSSYAEALIDDIYMLEAAFKVIDQNPLGSAAGYGSSFAIDRQYTTQSLGFTTLKFNSVAAQMDRGKAEKCMAFAMSTIAGTLSKLSMDICLYLSQNFNFISFPDKLTTGSSIMPHKKNPDAFELIRGKCNEIQALPQRLILLSSNLPSGYHRDFQLSKGIIIPAIDILKDSLEIMSFALRDITVNKNILQDNRYDYMFSVDTLNELVKNGVSFRDAYRETAHDIGQGTFLAKKSVNHSHVGSIGNLCLDEINSKMHGALTIVRYD